nr:uncharacterized protein LOC113400441 [Vanessa tameamea]
MTYEVEARAQCVFKRSASPTFTTLEDSNATIRVSVEFLKHLVYNILKNMAAYKVIIVVALFCVVAQAQRPFYAGLRPIGYPAAESNPLANRFGEDSDVPIEARGDGNLINRLDAMPVDKQPFWYLNWRQYDEVRKNPQTYPVRPSVFASNQ